MKKIFLLLLPVLFCIHLFIGCEENNSWLTPTDNGPMIIERVVDPRNWDKPLQGAELEQMIKLIGKNLNNADTIVINDVGVSMPGDAMIINGEIYLRVPYSAPTEMDNKIKITDIYGRTVEYSDFSITIPRMVATGMDLEWGAPGTDVTIYGNYFDLYRITDEEEDSHIMIGDKEAAIVETTKTAVTITIPMGAIPNSDIVVKSATGETVKLPFKYRESRWLMSDFSGLDGNTEGNWLYQSSALEEGDPDPVDGTYLKNKSSFNGGWNADGWNIFNLWANEMGNKLPDDINTNRDKYYFKFEAWTANEPIQFVRFEFESWDPGETRCWWYDPNAGFSEPVIGKWTTVSIPAENILDGSGAIGTIKCFRIVGQGPEAGEVYIAIDNPRFSLKQAE